MLLNKLEEEKKAIQGALAEALTVRDEVLKRVEEKLTLATDLQGEELTPENINSKLHTVARQIALDYAGKRLLMIGLIDGCIPLLGRLLEILPFYGCNPEFTSMSAKSYTGDKQGELTLGRPKQEIAERYVLLVDDTADSGKTAQAVLEEFRLLGAKTIREDGRLDFLALANKMPVDAPEWRQNIVTRSVFDLNPNSFIVGEGLDYYHGIRSVKQGGIYNVDPSSIATDIEKEKLSTIPQLNQQLESINREIQSLRMHLTSTHNLAPLSLLHPHRQSNARTPVSVQIAAFGNS